MIALRLSSVPQDLASPKKCRREAAVPPAAIIFASLCFLALGAASQEIPSATSASDVVQGTVINAVTGEGIGRALVYSPDNRYAAFTDGQGHFQFTLPKSSPPAQTDGISVSTGLATIITARGPVMFSARKPGFIDESGFQTQVSSGKDVVLSLLPEAIIQGRILLSDSDAAAGINVELFTRQVQDGRPHWTMAQSANANSSGEFRFAELRPGAYKVMTRELLDTDAADLAPKSQIYGFPPASFPGVNDFASGQTIQLAAGQVFQADIALKRQPYFPVKIPVANFADGLGMNVLVLAQGHPGPGYSLGYNPSTQRIEGLLPKGAYLVEATSFGQEPASGATNLTVTGNASEGTALTMLPSAQIPINVREEFTSDWSGTSSFNNSSGRVFTFRNGPRTYLNVWLEPADDFLRRGGGSPRPPRSANDDTLVIEGVQPGRYWVRAQTSRGYIASATSGTTDLMHKPLTVPPGGGTQVNLTMRDDTARLEGTVTGVPVASSPLQETSGVGQSQALNKPAAYIYCVPLADGPGQYAEFWADSTGQFNFPDIAPGVYRMLAFARPQPSLPYRDTEAMRAYESQGTVVRASPGQTQTVQVQLISGDSGQ